MPEGPEVKRLVDSLQIVTGEWIQDIEFLSGRYMKAEPSGFSAFSAWLESCDEPTEILSINCKGKFIWFDLGEWKIFSTLGMTGTYKLEPNKYARFCFDLTPGPKLYYCDMRNFGTIKFTKQAELDKKLKELGPDMLNNPCSFTEWQKICEKHKNKTLVKFLLEQKAISGVGNIYKSESLYLAKLDPNRQVKTMTLEESDRLYHAVRKILRNSYSLGGATIANYSDLDNNEGKYTRFASTAREIKEARAIMYLNHAQDEWEDKSGVMVYGQKCDPFGNKVETIALDDGRTTHWVPGVQK